MIPFREIGTDLAFDDFNESNICSTHSVIRFDQCCAA